MNSSPMPSPEPQNGIALPPLCYYCDGIDAKRAKILERSYGEGYQGFEGWELTASFERQYLALHQQISQSHEAALASTA